MHTPVLVAFMLTALRLSREGERGRTVGRITLGLGVATVIGVPVGNFLSETLGWQWAFALIAVLIGATLLIVLIAFPDDRSARGETGWRSLRVLARVPVVGGIAMTALAGLGAMVLLAFSVPFLTSAGISDTAVAPLLLIYGAACLARNVIGGRLADRGLGRALTITLTGTGLALLVAGLIGTSTVGAVVGLALVGITYFSTFPPLNTWIATNADGIAPGRPAAVGASDPRQHGTSAVHRARRVQSGQPHHHPRAGRRGLLGLARRRRCRCGHPHGSRDGDGRGDGR